MMDLVSFNYLNKKRIVFFENEYCDDFVKYKKENYIKNEMEFFDFFLKIDVKNFRIIPKNTYLFLLKKYLSSNNAFSKFDIDFLNIGKDKTNSLIKNLYDRYRKISLNKKIKIKYKTSELINTIIRLELNFYEFKYDKKKEELYFIKVIFRYLKECNFDAALNEIKCEFCSKKIDTREREKLIEILKLLKEMNSIIYCKFLFIKYQTFINKIFKEIDDFNNFLIENNLMTKDILKMKLYKKFFQENEIINENIKVNSSFLDSFYMNFLKKNDGDTEIIAFMNEYHPKSLLLNVVETENYKIFDGAKKDDSLLEDLNKKNEVVCTKKLRDFAESFKNVMCNKDNCFLFRTKNDLLDIFRFLKIAGIPFKAIDRRARKALYESSLENKTMEELLTSKLNEKDLTHYDIVTNQNFHFICLNDFDATCKFDNYFLFLNDTNFQDIQNFEIFKDLLVFPCSFLKEKTNKVLGYILKNNKNREIENENLSFLEDFSGIKNSYIYNKDRDTISFKKINKKSLKSA